MLRAIPKDVGPKTAPAAIIDFVSSTFNRYAMIIPNPMGKILPKMAIKKPLVPINFSVPKSMSIPASTTRRIRLR
jgi:hypothetical protein